MSYVYEPFLFLLFSPFSIPEPTCRAYDVNIFLYNQQCYIQSFMRYRAVFQTTEYCFIQSSNRVIDF